MAKPNIEQVFQLFQGLGNSNLQIMRKYSPGEWAGKMAEARAQLRVQLEAMGLAQHIDWEDKGS